MAIEFCFVDANSGDEAHNTLVDCGDTILLPDFSGSERQVIAIGCEDNGMSGSVKTLPGEGLIAKKDFESPLSYNDLPDAIGTVRITADRAHYQDIVSEHGEKATLLIRRVGDNAITRSGLIPKGLIYPN